VQQYGTFREAILLENLEKSGNSKVVRENEKNKGNVGKLGKVKSLSSFSPTTTDTSTDIS